MSYHIALALYDTEKLLGIYKIKLPWVGEPNKYRINKSVACFRRRELQRWENFKCPQGRRTEDLRFFDVEAGVFQFDIQESIYRKDGWDGTIIEVDDWWKFLEQVGYDRHKQRWIK